MRRRPGTGLRPRATAAGLLALLSLLASACSWSVPADPGLNARARSRPRAETEAASAPPSGVHVADDGMRSSYVARCGRCHAVYDPSHATADEWPGIVRRMAPRAGVFGAERARLLSWLQANAR